MDNIGASIITTLFLGVPDYKHIIKEPKTLLKLRHLHYLINETLPLKDLDIRILAVNLLKGFFL